MAQRIVTASILIACVVVVLCLGGVAVGLAAMLCICFAVYEEFRAFTIAKHRPVSWPTWCVVVLSVPLTYVYGVGMLVVLLMTACLLTMAHVIFRSEPKLEDILVSVMPLLTVMLPGLCIVGIASIEPVEVQRVLLCLVLAVPIMCDTMAYFVGSTLRGPKLCPAVSPNKTISGALGGMCGALIASGLVALIAHWTCSPEVEELLPSWQSYLLMGLIGGVASQLGDLFASLVKRHSGIKDFSNLFPGHGGMLDRMDSVLFMAVVVVCMRILSVSAVF